MPETSDAGIWATLLPQLLIIVTQVVGFLIILGKVGVRQVEVRTDQHAVEVDRAKTDDEKDRLFNQVAALGLKNADQLADARVAAAVSAGEQKLLQREVEYLKQDNARLNQLITDGNTASASEIAMLKDRVNRQQALIDGLPDLVSMLRTEVRVNKDASATPEQVAAAEQASAAATAATLSPVAGTLAADGEGKSKIEGVVKLTPTDEPLAPIKTTPIDKDKAE